MILEDKLVGPTTALEEESEPAFEEKAAAALDNADIQVEKNFAMPEHRNILYQSWYYSPIKLCTR